MDPKKIQTVSDIDPTKINTLRDVRAFLGLTSYYRPRTTGLSRASPPTAVQVMMCYLNLNHTVVTATFAVPTLPLPLHWCDLLCNQCAHRCAAQIYDCIESSCCMLGI